ncbi:MAG: PqqD family protein [Gemmatimonadetes bacterium]|nr:PqqD family protein [Gemmatimonadota bacterium]
MATRLSLDDVLVVSTDQVSADLSGETVILGMREGAYFGVRDVGARIWALLQQPRRLAEVVAILADEYEVDAPTCEADVLAFAAELFESGLVNRQNAPVG